MSKLVKASLIILAFFVLVQPLSVESHNRAQLRIVNTHNADNRMIRITLGISQLSNERFSLIVEAGDPWSETTARREVPIGKETANQLLSVYQDGDWACEEEHYDWSKWSRWHYTFSAEFNGKQRVIPPDPVGHDRLLVNQFLEIEELKSPLVSVLSELASTGMPEEVVRLEVWQELFQLEGLPIAKPAIHQP